MMHSGLKYLEIYFIPYKYILQFSSSGFPRRPQMFEKNLPLDVLTLLLLSKKISIEMGDFVKLVWPSKKISENFRTFCNVLLNNTKYFFFVYSHRMYRRTVSSQRLLSALLNQLELVYWLFGLSNMHCILAFRPALQENNQIYQR